VRSEESAPAAVVFDGDDTLWSTEPLYDRAREDARVEVVESTFVDIVSDRPTLPATDEPILTWLHPPDTKPQFVRPDDFPGINGKRR